MPLLGQHEIEVDFGSVPVSLTTARGLPRITTIASSLTQVKDVCCRRVSSQLPAICGLTFCKPWFLGRRSTMQKHPGRNLAAIAYAFAFFAFALSAQATPYQRFVDGFIDYRGWAIGSFSLDWHWNDASIALERGIAAPPSLPLTEYRPKPEATSQFFSNLTLTFAPLLPYGGNDPFCGGANATVTGIGCTYVFGPASPNAITAGSLTTTAFQVGHNFYGPGRDTFDMFSTALVGQNFYPFALLFNAVLNSGCLANDAIAPILAGGADCVLNNGRMNLVSGNGFLEQETAWAGLLGLSSVIYGDYIDRMGVASISPIPEPASLLSFGFGMLVLALGRMMKKAALR